MATEPWRHSSRSLSWLNDVRRTRRPKRVQSYKIALNKLVECIPEAGTRSANRDMKALKACLAWAWLNELPHPPVQLKRLLLPPPPRKDETLAPE